MNQTTEFAIPQIESYEPIVPKRMMEFFRVLAEDGIHYCHWKSNLRLNKGLNGLTDLDLLIALEQRPLFKRVLFVQGFRLVIAPPGKRYPSIEDYLGFDMATGKLFHLHVHYQLVLGEQFVKNYIIPLEKQFLESVRVSQGVCIPSVELELIVLSMRALLKYRDRDALKDILSIRSSGIPADILNEIHWLLGQTSIDKVMHVLQEISDVIPAQTILKFILAVVSSPRDGFALFRLRGQIRRGLRPYQRGSRVRATLTYFQEMLRRRRSLLRPQSARGMTLGKGGVTFALVGVDGSGKTTQSRELVKWLSWKMDVHLHYLGSKQPSWLSKGLYTGFRAARKLQRAVTKSLGEENPVSNWATSGRQAFLYGYYLSVGHDRYRRYRQGVEQAKNGSIVIFDRFPFESPLDGPEICVAADGYGGPISRYFSFQEEILYRKFKLPDCLIVLNVNPEISIERKPDHPWDAILAKQQALRSLCIKLEEGDGQSEWIVVNADVPFEEVLLQLKKTIWARL